MIHVCELNRRLRFPKGVCLITGTTVVLQASLDKDDDINLFFDVISSSSGKLINRCEVDSILDMSEVPNPAGNKQQWEKVRKLVRDDMFSPNDAWLLVAMRNAVRNWKFSVEEDEVDVPFARALSFSIQRRTRDTPLEASMEPAVTKNIFDFAV